MNIGSGRQLAAVMFADVEGYTSLMQREENASLEARRRHRAALHAVVPLHGGRIVQFLGDGSLCIFPSAVEAVHAAVEIQRFLSTPPQLPLRIGIHQGEITWDEQGIVGDSVNIAARVQALGCTGSVLVTDKIQDEIKNQPALPLVDLGLVRLKGVARALAIHAVATEGLSVPHPAAIPRSTDDRKPRSASLTEADSLHGRATEHVRARIAAALETDYVIESALDAGGMGLVFRGHDRVLRRPVAIKVMRPELMTDRGVERFLREARILARLRHPAVVPVHRAGEADGLPYYVMDLLEGETLEERLRAGPLRPAELLPLALSLLDGLAAAHREGVVHRDIKPSNVFLTRDGGVLTDFGIARTATAATTGSDESGRPTGTPGYMPPEQAEGGEITPLTDLHASAMVFFEALTGRRWDAQIEPREADWNGVPAGWIAPLRRALARVPAERWRSAHEFSRALGRVVPTSRWKRNVGVIAVAIAIVSGITAVGRAFRGDAITAARLAIFPFEMDGPDGDGTGQLLAALMRATMSIAPGLVIAPPRNAAEVWNPTDGLASFDARAAARRLRVDFVTVGHLQAGSDSMVLHLWCYDSTGTLRFADTFSAAADGLRALADHATADLIAGIDPRLTIRRSDVLTSDEEAWGEFLFAELFVEANDWSAAVEHYERAIERDPDFAMARWRLINARRWLPLDDPSPFDPRPELERIAATSAGRLSPVDSALLEAQLAMDIRVRLERYAEANRRFPDDGFAALLHGDELFHRGALAGRTMEDAARELWRAGQLQPSLAPAFEHLAWLYIRNGNEEAARVAVDRYQRTAADKPGARQNVALITLAFLERFDSVGATRERQLLFGGSDLDVVDRLGVARIGLAFDLPLAQYALGAQLASHPLAAPQDRAKGRYAMALSLFSLGQWRAGLIQLDSAAGLDGSMESGVQGAEWRVLPAAIGLPAVDEQERLRGLAALRRMRGAGEDGARAGWALAVAAMASGDTAAARTWLDSSAVTNPSLRGTIEALLIGARGEWRAAIDRTAPLLERDHEPGHGDPFVRSILHSRRAEWFESLAAADPGAGAILRDSVLGEWRWVRNIDLSGWVDRAPQSAEVDWVLSPWAGWRFARFSADDSGCGEVERTLGWWARADDSLAPILARLREFAATYCDS